MRSVQWAAARRLIINTGLLLFFPFPTDTRPQQRHINFPSLHSSPVSLGGGGGGGIFSETRP